MLNYNDPNLVWVEREGFKMMVNIKFLGGPLDCKVLYGENFPYKFEVVVTQTDYSRPGIKGMNLCKLPVLMTATYTKVRQCEHIMYPRYDGESSTHLWEVYLWDDLKPDEREYTLNVDWYEH